MNESSRRRAQTWSYPRRIDFERYLRGVAAEWFRSKGYPTQNKYPFILANYADWRRNIILPEVAAFIEAQRQGFPLHKYIHHGLSSQAMLFNLVGSLIVRDDLLPLLQVFSDIGIQFPIGTITAQLEYENRAVFNEDSGQPTSIDLTLHDVQQQPFLFIESKLVERGFGGCSVFESGDCDGRNPAKDFSLCYLHHIGRKYWELLDKHGFLACYTGQNITCVLSTYYQFFREVIMALELGGAFVLLYDRRNPSFSTEGVHGKRGVLPFLLEFVPAQLCDRVGVIDVQSVVAKIKATGRHEWIDEFERKYGLT